MESVFATVYARTIRKMRKSLDLHVTAVCLN